MRKRIRQDLRSLFGAAVQAVDPRRTTREAIAQAPLEASKIWIVGAGKAAAGMGRGAIDVLESRVAGGVLIVPEGYAQPVSGLTVLEAGHPLPDQRGVDATQALLEVVDAAGRDDLVICLLSGGGSAVLVAPRPGVDLRTLAETTQTHLRSGTPIAELNRIRTQLSAVKGGQLEDRIAPARVLTYAISDVPGDDLEVLASGPTRAGRVIGNLSMALQAAAEHSTALGYRSVVHPDRLEGEARSVGDAIGVTPVEPGSCHIWGGECTVTVKGEGVGGRCQELALAAALHIDDDRVLLAAGTDGVDGPTRAAGAIVDRDTVQDERRARTHLDANDAGTFLKGRGHLLHTGPTGTNVADVVILARPSR